MTVIVLLAVLLGGGAVALLYRINKWDSPNDEKTSNTARATPETRPSESASDKSTHLTPTPVPAKTPNLNGEWSMVNTIERTSYPAYANLRIGYHLVITQTGTEFTANGEKVSENGRVMSDYERTPIQLTGSVGQSGHRNFFRGRTTKKNQRPA